MKRLILLLPVVLFVAPPVVAQQIAGQKPVVMIGDTFQFTPGSWASYIMHDKTEDTYYTFTMSILESVRKNGKDAAWMEVEIETDKELVVTRFLTEKTKNGPGDLFEAIVYVYGFTPFSIPEKWMKGDDRKVGDFEVAHVQKRVSQRSITFAGQRLEVIEMDALDANGTPIAATASLDVPPIAVLTVDTKDVGMYLEAWGTGAKTRIVGEPESFFMWMMGQMSRAFSGDDVDIKPRPQRAFDVAGSWEEMDGPCAGSRWTITGAFPAAVRLEADSRCEGQTLPVARAANARWRMDKLLSLSLPGRGPSNSRVSLVFSSATRAVVAFTDRNGRPALATLRKGASGWSSK